MSIFNPDPLRFPGSANTSNGTKANAGMDPAAATQWLQQQPWYQQTLASWGNPKTLTLGQRGYLARTAIAAGMDPSFGVGTNGEVENWSMNNPMFWAGVSGMTGGLGPVVNGGALADALPGAELGGSKMGITDLISGLLTGGNGGGVGGILNTAQNLSQVLGGAAGGAAALQGQSGQLANIQGNLQQQLYNDAVNRFLTQNVTLPSEGADMARKGDLQANVQDVRSTMTPGAGYSFSGGLRPSALGPNARQAGQNLSRQGLNLQSMQMPALPNIPNVQINPSGFQQALQYGALGSGVLGAFQKNPIQQWLASQNAGGGGGVLNYGPEDPYTSDPIPDGV